MNARTSDSPHDAKCTWWWWSSSSFLIFFFSCLVIGQAERAYVWVILVTYNSIISSSMRACCSALRRQLLLHVRTCVCIEYWLIVMASSAHLWEPAAAGSGLSCRSGQYDYNSACLTCWCRLDVTFSVGEWRFTNDLQPPETRNRILRKLFDGATIDLYLLLLVYTTITVCWFKWY